MTLEEYCRLVRSGIINQRRAVRGFLALARIAHARGHHDLADLMASRAASARISLTVLQRQLRRRCLNGVTTNGINNIF